MRHPLAAAVALHLALGGAVSAQEIIIVPLDDLQDEPGLTLDDLEEQGIELETFTVDPLGLEAGPSLSDEEFQTFEQETAVSLAEAGNLRVLDKLTGRVEDVSLEAGQSATVGRIEVTLHECRYPTESPSADAFVRLAVADTEGRNLFDGWMVASSPALMALDHPRYDVWALRCTLAPDEDLPEITELEAAQDEAVREASPRAVAVSIRPRPRP